MDNKWVKAGFQGMKAMSEAGGQGGGGGGGGTAGPQSPGGQAPPMNPYKSGHVQAQNVFSQTLMDEYLSGGGVHYG